MPRYYFDADRGGLCLLDAFKGEVSADEAQVLATMELGKTMREIAEALKWLSKSDKERANWKRAVELVEESMGEQFAKDRELLSKGHS